MELAKKSAKEKVESLFDLYGNETNLYFQKRLIKAVFIMQTMTPPDVTKEQISAITEAIEMLYNVFEPENLQGSEASIKEFMRESIRKGQ